MGQGQWYYCLDHKTIEPYEACRSDSRLGPYASQEDARHALEKVHERNDQWDTDPRFNDPDEDEDSSDDEDRHGWGPFRS